MNRLQEQQAFRSRRPKWFVSEINVDMTFQRRPLLGKSFQDIQVAPAPPRRTRAMSLEDNTTRNDQIRVTYQFPPSLQKYVAGNKPLDNAIQKEDSDDSSRLPAKDESSHYLKEERETIYQEAKEFYKNGDKLKAAKYFEIASIQGHGRAQFWIGGMYLTGDGILQNRKRALVHLQAAADQQVLDANYLMGTVYEYGNGVEKNHKAAVMWYESVAHISESENAQRYWDEHWAAMCNSCYRYGCMIYRGEGVERKSDSLGLIFLRNAFRQGHIRAGYKVGRMLYHGRGTVQNKKKAAHFWKITAENGESDAMYRLALLYRDGEGVERNEAKSASWLRAAALHGNSQAQYELATLCEEGTRGIKRNITQAIYWYQKAAEEDHPSARFKLVSIYMFTPAGLRTLSEFLKD